jgi:hypothetical protein
MPADAPTPTDHTVRSPSRPKTKLKKFNPKREMYVVLACVLLAILASVGFLMYALGSRRLFHG